jgi:hypothetical protein
VRPAAARAAARLLMLLLCTAAHALCGAAEASRLLLLACSTSPSHTHTHHHHHHAPPLNESKHNTHTLTHRRAPVGPRGERGPRTLDLAAPCAAARHSLRL